MWGGVGMGGGGAALCLLCLLMESSSALAQRGSLGALTAEGRREAGQRAGALGSLPPGKGPCGDQTSRSCSGHLKSEGSPQACFLFSFLFLLKLPPGRKELGSGAGFAPGARPGHPSPGGRTPLSCRTHQQELETKEDLASDQPP